MVGHTHEAVDRYFSYINKCLTEYGDTITGKDMFSRIRNYLKTDETLEAHDLDFVADWTKWMEGCDDVLHDHTGKGSALHWRFERDTADGPVLLRQKHLSTDELWIPREGIKTILRVPTGVPMPDEYRPLGGSDSFNYLARLRKTIQRLDDNRFLQDSAQREWWKELLDAEEKLDVPHKYTADSDTRLVFPTRSQDDSIEGLRLAEEERRAPVGITDVDRERFGSTQRKEAYVGKSQSRKKRNDHAANPELMNKGSFVMLLGEDKEEPFLFGIVTEVDVESMTFKMQYCGRDDNSSLDLRQTFTPLFKKGQTSRAKKTASASPWIAEFNFDNIMLFDINTSQRKTARTTFTITKAGIARCLEAIENTGDVDHHIEEDEQEFNHDDVSESNDDFESD